MCPNAAVGGTGEGGNIRESIPGVSHFRTDEPEGESCVFDRLGGCGGRMAAYPNLSRRSEQLSCTKFFHPSYGLFYINSKRILSFSRIIRINLIRKCHYDVSMTSG